MSTGSPSTPSWAVWVRRSHRCSSCGTPPSVRAASCSIFGNGGSAGNAQHLATELAVRYEKDRAAIAALALTADSLLLSAAANDLGFEAIFSRQIAGLGCARRCRRRDVYLRTQSQCAGGAARGARARPEDHRPHRRQRRPDARAVRCAIIVPSQVTARIQEMHLLVTHMLCKALEAPRHGIGLRPMSDAVLLDILASFHARPGTGARRCDARPLRLRLRRAHLAGSPGAGDGAGAHLGHARRRRQRRPQCRGPGRAVWCSSASSVPMSRRANCASSWQASRGAAASPDRRRRTAHDHQDPLRRRPPADPAHRRGARRTARRARGRSAAGAVQRRAPDADVVILSDYGKGALSDTVTARAIAAATAAGKRVLVDPKSRSFAKYQRRHRAHPQ